MTKELIEITIKQIDEALVQTVNARELHSFLQSKQDFTSWIKVQIERAKLLENQDFIVLTKKGENSKGGRPSKEYYLTINSGKHISMLSGTDKGKQVREYFIECERKLVYQMAEQSGYRLPRNFSESLKMLAVEVEKTEKLTQIVEEQQLLIEDIAPKAEVYDKFINSESTLSVKEFAEVAFDILKLGEKNMFKELRSKHFVTSSNLPYQKYITQGIFKVREIIYNYNNQEVIYSQIRITPKGQNYLITNLNHNKTESKTSE